MKGQKPSNTSTYIVILYFRTGLDTKYVLLNDETTGLLTYVGNIPLQKIRALAVARVEKYSKIHVAEKITK